MQTIIYLYKVNHFLISHWNQCIVVRREKLGWAQSVSFRRDASAEDAKRGVYNVCGSHIPFETSEGRV